MKSGTLLWCIVLAPLVPIVWYEIYCKTSHSSYRDRARLREDAIPINVSRKTVGLKGSKTYRTTVYFDDGFEFISHKQDREDHLFYYTISMSESEKDEIIADAISAHKRAVKRANRFHKNRPK